jgi:hypothetical protein
VQTIDRAGKLIELLIVDVGEYRNTTERGSLISRTPLGPSPFSAHEARLPPNMY